MTTGTVAATGWHTNLQVRNTGVAEGTIVHMGGNNGPILVDPWIVTGQTYGRAGHIALSHMVNIAVVGQILV